MSGFVRVSTELSKAVPLLQYVWFRACFRVCLSVCHFVLVFFSVLLVLRLLRLGKTELILLLFVRLFGLWLFRFVGFLFLLGSGKGCGL